MFKCQNKTENKKRNSSEAMAQIERGKQVEKVALNKPYQ